MVDIVFFGIGFLNMVLDCNVEQVEKGLMLDFIMCLIKKVLNSRTVKWKSLKNCSFSGKTKIYRKMYVY